MKTHKELHRAICVFVSAALIFNSFQSCGFQLNKPSFLKKNEDYKKVKNSATSYSWNTKTGEVTADDAAGDDNSSEGDGDGDGDGDDEGDGEGDGTSSEPSQGDPNDPHNKNHSQNKAGDQHSFDEKTKNKNAEKAKAEEKVDSAISDLAQKGEESEKVSPSDLEKVSSEKRADYFRAQIEASEKNLKAAVDAANAAGISVDPSVEAEFGSGNSGGSSSSSGSNSGGGSGGDPELGGGKKAAVAESQKQLKEREEALQAIRTNVAAVEAGVNLLKQNLNEVNAAVSSVEQEFNSRNSEISAIDAAIVEQGDPVASGTAAAIQSEADTKTLATNAMAKITMQQFGEGLKGTFSSQQPTGAAVPNAPANPSKEQQELSELVKELQAENFPEGLSKETADVAQQLLDIANKNAEVTTENLNSNNQSKESIERGERKIKLAKEWKAYATQLSKRSLKDLKSAEGIDREQAASVANNVMEIGNHAASLGQNIVADHLHGVATNMMKAALIGARLIPHIDAAANALEAFAGKSLEVGEDGQIAVRDATQIEGLIAAADLAITIGVAFYAGIPAAVALSVVVGISEVVGKKAMKEAFEKIEKQLAEKVITQAEKEAAEQSLKNLSEEEAKKIAETITKLVKEVEQLKHLSPTALKHIIEGNIGADGLLKGGLHTVEGLKKFMNSLPTDVQAAIKITEHPNGVKVVIFPGGQKALNRKAEKATERAAAAGRGVENGKTLFPESWTATDIDNAIEVALKQGKVINENAAQGSKIYSASVNGVNVEVAVGIKAGGGFQVNSAYPSAVQP